MPNTASAKKRLRQDVGRRARNRAVKSVLRKRIRTIRESVVKGELAQADELYRVAAMHLDRASAKRIIHPNAAARSKSRLQSLITKAKAAKSA